jgi:hypothetical protein
MVRFGPLLLLAGLASAQTCEQTLMGMASTPAGQAAISMMQFASAQNLPNDAGKYVTCEALSNPLTKQKLSSLHLVTYPNALLVVAGQQVAQKMEIGVCFPKACTREDVSQLMNKSTPLGSAWGCQWVPMICRPEFIPGNPFVESDRVTSTSQADLRSPDAKCWVAVAICASMSLLIAASTFMTCAAQRRVAQVAPASDGNQALLEQGGEAPPRARPGMEKNVVIRAFSLVGSDGTWDKLWQIPAYKNTDCLNGLRVLSMFWVVLGHSFLMSEGIAGYENPQDISNSAVNPNAAETDWKFMFVLNAQMSVDTFFFLGGFLFSLLTVKELQRSRGKFNHIQALILRYLRLTPSLGFVMMVYYLIWPYFAHGPFAPRFQNSIYRRCDISWWSELTYSINFVPRSSDDVCMGWTWYLGDDMIFFIVGILVLPLYHKSRVIAWCSVILMTIASFAITGYLIFKYHLAPEALDYHNAQYSLYAYSKPYTRIPVYFVGVASAWVLIQMEEKGITTRTGWVGNGMATALWWTAMIVLTFITFIVFSDHGNYRNSWSDMESFFYLTFSRPIWAVCWAIVTFLCYYGHAPATDAFLAHRFWTPFARLTMVHISVILSALSSLLDAWCNFTHSVGWT